MKAAKFPNTGTPILTTGGASFGLRRKAAIRARNTHATSAAPARRSVGGISRMVSIVSPSVSIAAATLEDRLDQIVSLLFLFHAIGGAYRYKGAACDVTGFENGTHFTGPPKDMPHPAGSPAGSRHIEAAIEAKQCVFGVDAGSFLAIRRKVLSEMFPHCCCSADRVSLVQRCGKQVVLLLLLMLLLMLAREDADAGVMGVEMIEVKGGCLQVTLEVRPRFSRRALSLVCGTRN